MIGLASPFLEMSDPMHGIIGLIILLVGLQIAWKITAARKLDIVGPVSEPSAAAAPAEITRAARPACPPRLLS
jgi:hypothetical protein